MKKLCLSLTAALLVCGSMQLMARSSEARSRSYRMSVEEHGRCQTSLKNLYVCLKLYAADHKGEFPRQDNAAGLEKLFKSGALLRDFVCQSYKGRSMKKIEDFNEATSPYLYFGGAGISGSTRVYAKMPLICDKPGTRHLNVLTADGQVDSIDLKKSKRKISNCSELVALLNSVYKYPSALLKALQRKAKAMDKKFSTMAR